MKYRWIHLSDIHFAYKNYQSNRLRGKLFDKIAEIVKQDKVNFLFITGDITDKDAEYDEDLYKFITELLRVTELDEKHLFFVPGNHDVSRKSKERIEKIVQIREAADKGLDVVNDLSDDSIEMLLSAQQKFFTLYEHIKKEKYPVKDIHFVREVDGAKIIHFNTAWLCGMDGEEGRLFLGSNKLYSCLKDAGLKADDLNIAIGHHSFECFHRMEQDQLKGFMKDYNIDFYLSGHLHEAMINYNSHIDTHFCVCRQMRSDNFDAGGLAIGNIDTETGNNNIQFHAWNQRGYWTWDTEVGHEAPYGIYSFNTAKFPATKYRENPVVVIHKTMNTPINQQKLLNDMGFGKVPVYHYPYSNIEISTQEEWMEHKSNTDSFINGVISRLKDNVVHIFPLSQIPLLIEMGYMLQNDNDNIKIYQFDENGKWVLDSENAEKIPVTISYIENNPKTKKLIVVLEISSTIKNEDIDVYVSTSEHSILRFTIDNPLRYKVIYESQVKDIKSKFRSETEKHIYDYDEIHLFAAMPAGLSVEVGRCILRSMWPKVYLYNHRRQNDPRYQFAFSIN
jgi:predicted phosphodiesterase